MCDGDFDCLDGSDEESCGGEFYFLNLRSSSFSCIGHKPNFLAIKELYSKKVQAWQLTVYSERSIFITADMP